MRLLEKKNPGLRPGLRVTDIECAEHGSLATRKSSPMFVPWGWRPVNLHIMEDICRASI
jgi:hypothetical protein